VAPEPITDIDLMAYADGEADAALAARVDRELARDPTVAPRLEMFTRSRASVKAAMDSALVPAPGALVARLRGMAEGKVAVLPQRPRPAWQPAAIAAGLALAVGLFTGWLAFRVDTVSGPVHLAVLDRPDVAVALATLPSGQSRDLDGAGRLTAIATFRDESGTLCREIEHDSPGGQALVAVACRTEGAWSVRLAIAAGASGGFAPASSLETLDAWLTATGASAPLDPGEEAAALTDLAKQGN